MAAVATHVTTHLHIPVAADEEKSPLPAMSETYASSMLACDSVATVPGFNGYHYAAVRPCFMCIISSKSWDRTSVRPCGSLCIDPPPFFFLFFHRGKELISVGKCCLMQVSDGESTERNKRLKREIRSLTNSLPETIFLRFQENDMSICRMVGFPRFFLAQYPLLNLMFS